MKVKTNLKAETFNAVFKYQGIRQIIFSFRNEIHYNEIEDFCQNSDYPDIMTKEVFVNHYGNPEITQKTLDKITKKYTYRQILLSSRSIYPGDHIMIRQFGVQYSIDFVFGCDDEADDNDCYFRQAYFRVLRGESKKETNNIRKQKVKKV